MNWLSIKKKAKKWKLSYLEKDRRKDLKRKNVKTCAVLSPLPPLVFPLLGELFWATLCLYFFIKEDSVPRAFSSLVFPFLFDVVKPRVPLIRIR